MKFLENGSRPQTPTSRKEGGLCTGAWRTLRHDAVDSRNLDIFICMYIYIIYVCLYIYLELGRVVNKMLALEKGRPGLLSLKEVRMVGTFAQLRIHINIHVRQHISMYYYIYVDMFWHICIAERNTNMESSKKKKEGRRGGKKLSYCACPL